MSDQGKEDYKPSDHVQKIQGYIIMPGRKKKLLVQSGNEDFIDFRIRIGIYPQKKNQGNERIPDKTRRDASKMFQRDYRASSRGQPFNIFRLSLHLWLKSRWFLRTAGKKLFYLNRIIFPQNKVRRFSVAQALKIYLVTSCQEREQVHRLRLKGLRCAQTEQKQV